MSTRPTTPTIRIGSPRRTEAMAVLALTAFNVVVALGFARVFAGWEFAWTLVPVVVVAHGVAYLLRIARVPFAAAVPLTVAAVVWTIGWLLYRDTYRLFLPTGDTWDRFQLDVDLVGERFRTEVAPVPFLQGWDVLAAIGVGLVAVLADTFAFRAFARAEALVPGGVLFVFISALGSDRARIGATVALVAVGVLATIALRVHHAAPDVPTIGRRPGNAARVGALGAVAVVVAVAAGAAVLGPRLPGADEDPLYDPTSGGGVTTVVSPLVDIRSRLTNRSETELFVVEATTDAYWRSSTLAAFDGQRWELPERPLQSAGDDLAAGAAGAVEVRQRVTITNLGGALLPAAAEPIAANPVGGGSGVLRFNADSSTLVQTDRDLGPGDAFEIVSAAPRFTADQLRATTSTDAGDPIYVELPDGFPTLASDLARQITAGAATSFDAALALQTWMRTEFDYSLEIQEGHGNNAMESFLINRVGYCEQFAGTYAAMMRSLGIPARVAVGFTPGISEVPGRYSVLGKNAHAWPEIWFDGLGWVPFEPTPGRGAPGAESWTGVAPQQDETPADPDGAADAGADEGQSPATTAPPTTVATDDTAGDIDTPVTVPPNAGDGTELLPDGGVAVPTTSGDDGAALPTRTLLLLAAIGLVAAAPAAVRRLRRRPHGPEIDQLERLWRRATSSLEEMGVMAAAGSTPSDVARHAAVRFPAVARPMEALAGVVTEVTYGPAGADRLLATSAYGTTVLGDCAVWTRQIEKTIVDSLTPTARLHRYATTWA